jgi:hypothetical protein
VDKPEGQRTTDQPLGPDRYHVWTDVETDRLANYDDDGDLVSIDSLHDEFKLYFAQAQGLANAKTKKQCRGYFINHTRNATWCGHPLCPSCWVRRQFKVRAAVPTIAADGWLVKISDLVGVNELYSAPEHFNRTFTSRNQPRVNLVAWWSELSPCEDFDVGWAARKIGLFTTTGPGPPPVRYDISGEDDLVGVPTFGDGDVSFATIWQSWFDNGDDAIAHLRTKFRSPWQAVFHPLSGVLSDAMKIGRIKVGRSFRSYGIG